jgi:hypothetical protein
VEEHVVVPALEREERPRGLGGDVLSERVVPVDAEVAAVRDPEGVLGLRLVLERADGELDVAEHAPGRPVQAHRHAAQRDGLEAGVLDEADVHQLAPASTPDHRQSTVGERLEHAVADADPVRGVAGGQPRLRAVQTDARDPAPVSGAAVLEPAVGDVRVPPLDGVDGVPVDLPEEDPADERGVGVVELQAVGAEVGAVELEIADADPVEVRVTAAGP